MIFTARNKNFNFEKMKNSGEFMTISNDIVQKMKDIKI